MLNVYKVAKTHKAENGQQGLVLASSVANYFRNILLEVCPALQYFTKRRGRENERWDQGSVVVEPCSLDTTEPFPWHNTEGVLDAIINL